MRNRAWILGTLLSAVCLSGCPQDPEPGPRPEPVEPLEDRDPEDPEPKPPFRFTEECRLPSVEEIRDDPVVRWAMQEAVRRAVVGEPSAQFLEQGGWIYQCRSPGSSGGADRYHLDVVTVEGGYRTRSQIVMRDAVYGAHMPDRPACRTVGQFHVHPDFDKTRASSSDLAAAQRRGIPSFLVHPEPGEGSSRKTYDRLPDWKSIPYGDWTEAGERNLSWTCDAGACSIDAAEMAALPEGVDPCGTYWTLSVSGGPAPGTYGGASASASIDRAGLVTAISLYTGTDARPAVTVQITPPGAGYEAGVPERRGFFEVLMNRGDPERVELDVDRWRAQRVGLVAAPEPHARPRVVIRRVTEEHVEGFAEGDFWQVVPEHKPDRLGRMRVEFRARACRAGEPGFSRCTMVQGR